MRLALVALAAAACSGTHDSAGPAAQTPPPAIGLQKVNHIIIVMMENNSFDNYFGALAYAPGSPYHTTSGGCSKEDHNCVDGLSCKVDAAGNLTCFNSNLDDNGTTVFAFHDSRRCVAPDLDHSWLGTHKEANFLNPNGTLGDTLSDGFVRV